MSKKTVELLKSVTTNEKQEFTLDGIERLADAVSSEVVKIQEKSQGLALKDNEIIKKINNLPNPSASVHLMIIATIVVPSTCFAVVGFAGGINTLFLVLSAIIGGGIAGGVGMAGLTTANDTYITKKQLENPSWFYKLMLKITPGASKKYRISQQNYRELTLAVETYQQYYNKKMQLIEPALDIINAHSQGITLSVDERGEIITTKTPHAQVKSKITKALTTKSGTPKLSNAK